MQPAPCEGPMAGGGANATEFASAAGLRRRALSSENTNGCPRGNGAQHRRVKPWRDGVRQGDKVPQRNQVLGEGDEVSRRGGSQNNQALLFRRHGSSPYARKRPPLAEDETRTSG